ncbi:imelysin family protein [Lacinutrix jangbogonensis]|uniref:imelysin family protein n=1 Tax=Lacinutrix jangbogonensis TaxID=1469557 RepID=UPI00053E62E3|nr:imelysin family protein [Lacinutrix jangbogonensis]
MKKNVLKITLITAVSILAYSCSSDDDTAQPVINEDTVTKTQVIENYASIVYQSYLDSQNSAISMQTAINTFVATPNETNFTSAKNAWLAAREFYGQTEVYRGSNGPIDQPDESWSINNEGQMNAWPIDESYIDYVEAGTEEYAGDFNSIIGDNSITISEATIASLNEGGANENEKAISSGWHAIEFLLWGQDNSLPSANLPGLRSFTDYTTATNADRRAQYLQVSTNLLINDLQTLVSTWNTGGTYRTVFTNLNENIALKQLITGAFFIAGDELSFERMIVAVDSAGGISGLGQEDEHSCFSDNTNRDVYTNAKGVYNVIFGEYSIISGASFYDLVKQANPTQAAALKVSADTMLAKVTTLGNSTEPFDLLITQETSTDTNLGLVMQAAIALQELGDVVSASATAIGISL